MKSRQPWAIQVYRDSIRIGVRNKFPPKGRGIAHRAGEPGRFAASGGELNPQRLNSGINVLRPPHNGRFSITLFSHACLVFELICGHRVALL